MQEVYDYFTAVQASLSLVAIPVGAALHYTAVYIEENKVHGKCEEQEQASYRLGFIFRGLCATCLRGAMQSTRWLVVETRNLFAERHIFPELDKLE